MKNKFNKFISKLTAVSLIASMLGGISVNAAEGDVLYSFDASKITAYEPANAPDYGFSFDSSNNVWSVVLEDGENKNSVYTPGIRFTTRKSDGGAYDLFKMTFANDTKNNASSAVFTDDGYTFEAEYSTVYNSDGYMSFDFIGKDSGGNEVKFANARITFTRSSDTGTFQFVDSSGIAIGEASTFDMNDTENNSGKIGVPMSLQYLKAEFDFANNTFSAWHDVRKEGKGAYTNIPASDDNLIVDKQPMNVSGIEEFVGILGAVTSNSATNGYRINKVTLLEHNVTVVPTADPSAPTATPEPTLQPTPAPDGSVLIAEEDFSDKTVSNNTISGWEFYDKTTKVEKFTNVTLSKQGNALRLAKSSIDGEEDYSTRWRSMYRFVENFAEDKYTKTYATNLLGKYRIETVVNSSVQSGSQFQEVNPAVGAEGTAPVMVYDMCIDSTGVYEYISSSEKPKLHASSVLNKDTTYTYEVDTATGECITKVNGGTEYVKSFSANTPLQGVMFILKSKAKAGDYMTVKDIKLYRYGEISGENEALQAAQSLTIDTLTSTPDGISSNLNTLPKSVDGAVVSWTSSDTAVISDSGKLLDQPLEGTTTVVMTATISKGDYTVYKDFTVKVKSVETSDFILINDVNFTDEENVAISNNSGQITRSADKIVLKRTSTSQTPTIKIYPMIDGKTKFNATGSWVWETEIAMPENKYQKAEVILYDTNGQRITTYYTTHESAGVELACVGRESQSASESTIRYDSGISGAVKMRLKVMFNTDTKRMSAYYALNDAANYTTVFENKFMREDAENLAYVQISAPSDNTSGNSSLFGSISVSKMKFYTLEANLIPLAINNYKYYNAVEALGGYIKDDVKLPTAAYEGMTVTWTSSKPEILTNDGKLKTEAFSSDTPVTLTFKIELSGTEYYEEKTFDLIALWVDKNNIALDKTIDAGNIVSMTGHSPQKAVDGSVGTHWQTMRFADLPSLKLDLGRNEVVKKIVLYEADMMGEYPIRGYTVEYSTDAITWNQLTSGTTLGSQPVTINVDSKIARYLRFNVTDKADDSCVGIKEFMVYGPIGEKEKAEADIILALDNIGTLTNLTGSKTLPTTMQYGSTISYASSIPSYFSNTGAVTQATALQSGKLTITATNGAETAVKEVAVSVAKKSGSPSGGSGGGGGSSSGGGSYAMPALPGSSSSSVETKPSNTGTFNDVTTSFWAYDYIEKLAAKGVVSGDEHKNFRPQDNVSRQEFVKMLLIALGVDTSGAVELSFSDVSEKDWSYPYIAKAVSLGIVNGVTDTIFAKESPITREDMAVMCRRAMNALNEISTPSGDLGFADGEVISDYAKEAILMMNEMGVISGYDDNTFRPKNNATRAEAAKIIYMLNN